VHVHIPAIKGDVLKQGLNVVILHRPLGRTSRMGCFHSCLAWFLLSGVNGFILAGLGGIGLSQNCPWLQARVDSLDLVFPFAQYRCLILLWLLAFKLRYAAAAYIVAYPMHCSTTPDMHL
jgi:hypothetical protein